MEVLERGRAHLARLGVEDPDEFDLFVALVGGLGDSQQANDPGGQRWARLLDQAMDMFRRLRRRTQVERHENDPTDRTATETTPRSSTLDRNTLMRLAGTEYHRFASLLCGLNDDDWALPTDCPEWDVRAMAGHVLGMAEMAASREREAASRRPRRSGAACSSTPSRGFRSRSEPDSRPMS
ncbi:MAG: maleylpyruvate isomerase N-terminal domain-containing protein [Nocardioidaceae bacterium]